MFHKVALCCVVPCCYVLQVALLVIMGQIGCSVPAAFMAPMMTALVAFFY
jgi:hypothetical protein